VDIEPTAFLELIDKLGLVAVLIFLLWQEKRQAIEWQNRYTALTERLLSELVDHGPQQKAH